MNTFVPTSAPAAPLNLNIALEAAVAAAHAGAAILQSYAQRRGDLVIDHKMRNDLVSQADREAEAAIIDILRAQTPQFGIVAEESGGQVQGTATWYIDPLDGTTNFLHGIPHYAVSIALVAQAGSHTDANGQLDTETPVVGVVYDPCREELFTAVHDTGVWLNGHRLSCSRATTLEDAVLATGFPFRDFSFADQYLPMLDDAIHITRGVRRHGAAALDLAWTAAGRFDGYWEMGLAPWDVAAGTLLVREAGGQVHDIYGKTPWPIGGAVVASGAALMPALQAMIAPRLRVPCNT